MITIIKTTDKVIRQRGIPADRYQCLDAGNGEILVAVFNEHLIKGVAPVDEWSFTLTDDLPETCGYEIVAELGTAPSIVFSERSYETLCSRVEAIDEQAAIYLRDEAKELDTFMPASVLSSAFTWSTSFQGHEYWSLINRLLGDD